MKYIFRQHLDTFVIIYLDDILIYGQTNEERMNHTRIVLETLRQHQLYAKMSKCNFCLHVLNYSAYPLNFGTLCGTRKDRSYTGMFLKQN
jgi:hypothetical protein